MKAIRLTDLRQLNEHAKLGGVLFTGSSLMEQFPICEYCMDAGIDEIVYNRGIGGYDTDEFLAAIDTQLFDLAPSKIFINIGTNDFKAREDGSDWEEHLLTNYEKILEQIRTRLPEAEVIMLAYYPVNEHMPEDKKSPWTDVALSIRTNEALKRVNSKVCALAEKFGYQFVNANAGLTDENGDLKQEYTVEGIHMHAAAYRQVFENIKHLI